MSRSKIAEFLLAVGLSLGATAVVAQSAFIDKDLVVGECDAGTCLSGLDKVFAQLDQLSLGRDDYNSQLGQIAAVLLQVAAATDDKAMLADLAAIFASLSQKSTDGLQRAAFNQIADNVRRGNADIYDTQMPFAVSPNRLPFPAFRNPFFNNGGPRNVVEPQRPRAGGRQIPRPNWFRIIFGNLR